MPDLADGESTLMQGSGKKPYVLKNIAGVYSCSCPAWINQSMGIEQRTCKHLIKLRGAEAEAERIGAALAAPASTEPAIAPPVLLAETWDTEANLTDWWMSEKLDGVRAYWDGKQFLSRQGNVYHAPDWFVAGLPDLPLDGELWIGRKGFQRAVSIARRQDKSEHWRELRYVLFDAPAHGGPFEERIRFLHNLLARRLEFVQVLPQEPCRGIDHLRGELRRVEELGGEGLMLRQPRSLYAAGRSSTLLKVKRFHDGEARVVDHEPGKGRHKGRLGALVVALSNGTLFSVGTGLSDAERSNPPPVGTIINFRYQELSDIGVPRFPSYVGISREKGAPSPLVNTPAPQLVTGVGDVSLAFAGSKPHPALALAAPVAPITRRFEYRSGSTASFWEATRHGVELTLRFGAIGTSGQCKTEIFYTEDAAQAALDELIAEKIDDGLVEQTAPTPASAPPTRPQRGRRRTSI
jgi:DNA ligase-1